MLLAAASGLAAVAILSRVTLGLGSVLALIGVTAAAGRTAPFTAAPSACDTQSSRTGGMITALVPVALFVVIQLAKFGALDLRPSQQAVNDNVPFIATYIRANGDRFFSPAFVPANFLTMVVWPTGVATSADFPWIKQSMRGMGPLVGHPIFLGRSWTGSLPGTQTALVLLALIGAARIFRRQTRPTGLDEPEQSGPSCCEYQCSRVLLPSSPPSPTPISTSASWQTLCRLSFWLRQREPSSWPTGYHGTTGASL